MLHQPQTIYNYIFKPCNSMDQQCFGPMSTIYCYTYLHEALSRYIKAVWAYREAYGRFK